MKKFGLLLIGGIAAVVLLGHLGPMIGLVISLAILYYAFKKFVKADSTGKKVIWGAIGILALISSISNVPAILGVVAAYVLYHIYKNWNKKEVVVKTESSDPFTNFEKQWAELNK